MLVDGLGKILLEKPAHGYKKSKIKRIYFTFRDRSAQMNNGMYVTKFYMPKL